MRFYKFIIITILAFGFAACLKKAEPATPLDTLKAYHEAIRKKDATTMKLLLSEGSLKLHQQEAQAQGLTLDDIVLRDTLFPADKKVFKQRNQKIEGNKASIEVENNIGGYDIIYLVLEDGVWKIDKKATSDQMIQEVETTNDDFVDGIEKERQEIQDNMDQNTPDPNASPSVSPVDPANPNPNETPKLNESSPIPSQPGDIIPNEPSVQ